MFNVISSQFDDTYKNTNSDVIIANILRDYVLNVWTTNTNLEYEHVESKLTDFKNSYFPTGFNQIQSVEQQPNVPVRMAGTAGIVSSEQYSIFSWDPNPMAQKNKLVGWENVYAIGSLNADDLFKIPRRFSVQTKQKSNIDESISKLKNRFDITNVSELKQFIISNPVQTIENFCTQLNQVTDMISSFLDTLSSESKNKIGIFKDEEINDFQSISIECYIKEANSTQCIELTDEIISKIIEIDEKILDVLQIEIIPYDQ